MADFKATFGCDPDVVAVAPGRVNLIGEHIDYSDGFVLPFAISATTQVAIGKSSDGVVRVVSAQKSSSAEIEQKKLIDMPQNDSGADGSDGSDEWNKYVLGVIWALGLDGQGLNIYVDGQVPVGAGLSSSAALECATAVALNELFNLNLSLVRLARAAQRAENEYVGVPCGIMDQSISLMGQSGSALLIDCRDLSTRDIPFDVASHGLELLVIDTQTHHALVDGGYAERRAACEAVVKILGITSLRDITIADYQSRKAELSEITYVRGLHAVTEMARVLQTVEALERDDFVTVGQLLNSSHQSLRDQYEVSCEELDLAVVSAISAGALGSRMVGGGFGGSAIALAATELIPAIKSAVTQAFAAQGFSEPRFFAAIPSQGARILET